MRWTIGTESRLRWHGLWAHAVVGAAAGMLLLHPVTKAIYGAEWHGARSEVGRIALAFTRGMLPMTGAFARVGAALGLVFVVYHPLQARLTSLPSVLPYGHPSCHLAR